MSSSYLLREVLLQLRNKWKSIIAISVLCGILLAFAALIRSKRYVAEAVIYPEEKEAVFNPLGNVIENFGGSDKAVGALKAILGSQTLRRAVVSSKVSHRGREASIADFIYEDEVEKKWWYGLLGDRKTSAEEKVVFAEQALNRSTSVSSTRDGFLTVEFTWTDDSLVSKVTTEMINQLLAYHRARKTEKAARDLQFISTRVDSIKKELDNSEFRLARFKDSYKYTTKVIDNMEQVELLRNREILEKLYVTNMVMKEEAIVKLQKDTPVVQVLDPPLPPFKVKKSSPLIYFFCGMLFAMVIIILWTIRGLVFRSIFPVSQPAYASAIS